MGTVWYDEFVDEPDRDEERVPAVAIWIVSVVSAIILDVIRQTKLHATRYAILTSVMAILGDACKTS